MPEDHKGSTEEALRVSEEAHRAAQKIAHLGHWKADFLTDSLSWSEGMYDCYQRTPETKPQGYETWLALVHPDDRERADGTVQGALATGDAFEFHWRYPAPDGSLRHILCRGEPITDERGEVVGLIGTDQDVTALRDAEVAARENEARFRALYEQAPCGYFTVRQRDNRIVQSNRAFQALLGYTAEELAQLPLRRLFSDGPDGYDKALEIHQRNLRAEHVQDTEIELRHKDGETIWVSLSISGETDSEGNLVETRNMAIDIRDRKAQEAERSRFERQLRHTQKLESLGLLAGGIAHDFNNLLMTILGNTEMALVELEDRPEIREYLYEVCHASGRAADLCRQMLALSGKGSFERAPIELSRLVSGMEDLLNLSVAKSIELETELAAPLPLLLGDEPQLSQMIMNLVVNAAEAMEDGTGTIRVATGTRYCDSDYLTRVLKAPERSPGTYVFLEVADDGSGMGEDTLEKIFDPFFSTKFTGRGLGMAAVLGIARGHRGAIHVISQPKVGTVFQIFFPATAQAEEEIADGFGEAPGPVAVLLADDETAVLDLGRKMLEHLGYQVFTAQDGREAVEVFVRYQPVIQGVILDLVMPELGGRETLQEIRRRAPDLPVLMSSGYTEQEVVQLLSRDSKLGFIQKPYTLDGLTRVVEEYLPAATG